MEIVENRPEERISGYLISDITACIDRKTEYYLWPFREMGERRHFNKGAGICQLYWLAYRKMWPELAAAWLIEKIVMSIAVYLLFRQSPGLLLQEPGLSGIVVDIFWTVKFVVYGYLGNQVYWHRIKKWLDRYGCKERMEREDRALHQELKTKGGVSVIGVIIAAILVHLAGRLWIRGLTFF